MLDRTSFKYTFLNQHNTHYPSPRVNVTKNSTLDFSNYWKTGKLHIRASPKNNVQQVDHKLGRKIFAFSFT